jgi:hypothetical protein
LLPRALTSVSVRAAFLRPALGIVTAISPDRYLPVSEAGVAISSSTLPCATMWPPWMPAPGPMSSTWSAVRMASSSCSTTITVLPRSRSR